MIAGPTASGKSAFALQQAKKWDGVIVNADSMQVYPVLRVLTARPDDRDLAAIPHRLYGHASLEETYSVALWLKDVRKVLNDIASDERIPVFVGGTGLYFKALVEGLADMPDIPKNIREDLRKRLEGEGLKSLREELTLSDPDAAKTIRPGDRQRTLRALEVYRTTGKSILKYQSAAHSTPVLNVGSIHKFVFAPERTALHQRIEIRFKNMLEMGAIDEVTRLARIGIADDHPVQKAIGVSQLNQYLSGTISRGSAIEKSIIATRQYAKRQSTWFRNQQSGDWIVYR